LQYHFFPLFGMVNGVEWHTVVATDDRSRPPVNRQKNKDADPGTHEGEQTGEHLTSPPDMEEQSPSLEGHVGNLC